MTKRVLRKAFKTFDVIKKNKELEIPGILGFTLNGKNKVEVPNRAGYVYVRLRSNLNEVMQAFNDQVSPVYGLPVILVRDEIDKTRYKVKAKDLGVYQSWGNASYLPRHGNQHSFNPDAGGGGDVVFIYNRQFVPLSVQPSGTNGAGSVLIQPYAYYQGAQWKYAGGTGTSSLLPYKPTGTSARMVLVYLDGDGNPGLLPGDTYFASSITGNAAVLPYMPSLASSLDIPLAGIRLVSGTSTIVWENIYDLRPLIVSDGFIPTGTSGHEIQDDGTPLAQRNALNFVGTNFAVYNTAGETNISGTAIGGGGIPERSLPIYEDSAFQVTGTIINFTDNLDVIVSGSVAHIQAQAGGAGLNVLGIFDDSVFKVSGTAISFDENLTVTVSGTFAFVSSTGGSGTSSSPIGARVYRTTDYTFTGTGANVGIAIPFTSERWDTDNIHSGSSAQLYCNTDGYYLISGNVSWQPLTGSYRLLGIKLNNGSNIAEVRDGGSSSYNQTQHISCIYYLNVGDYVQLVVDRGTIATDVIVQANNYSPEFMMQRIG